MSYEIRIGVLGRILAGSEIGSYVKVVDDTSATGGYLILIGSEPTLRDGFDDWVENDDSLRRYFEEAEWEVRWQS